MSTVYLENATSGLEGHSLILSRSMKSQKPPTFAEYLQEAMNSLGLNPFKLEGKSKDEAARRGYENDPTYTVSDATITNILSGAPQNLQMHKLCAIAWAINRPIEEVCAVAFGFAHRLSELQRSPVIRLWDSHLRLSGESADYFNKRMIGLKREMDDAAAESKRRSRSSE